MPNSVGRGCLERGDVPRLGRHGRRRSPPRHVGIEHGAREGGLRVIAAAPRSRARAPPSRGRRGRARPRPGTAGWCPGLSAALAVRATIVADALGASGAGRRRAPPSSRGAPSNRTPSRSGSARRRHVGRLSVELRTLRAAVPRMPPPGLAPRSDVVLARLRLRPLDLGRRRAVVPSAPRAGRAAAVSASSPPRARPLRRRLSARPRSGRARDTRRRGSTSGTGCPGSA